jgi:hypothetical protein
MATANQMVSKGVAVIIGLLVAGVLAANLLPTAIDEIISVDTSSWDSGTVAMWDLLPLLFILVILLVVIGWALDVF